MRDSERSSSVEIRPDPEDPSDLATLQARLYQAERLASLGTLATGVAHEVNNPLTYVLANLEFILEQLDALKATVPSEVLAEVRSAAQDAHEGADRVRVVIRDMHTVSRADADSIGATDVHAALDAALRLGAHALRSRAAVTKDFAEVPRVVANEGLLVQAFMNLLVNAAQAMQGFGQIEVRTRTLGDEWVVVEVEDNGEGIPRENLSRVFDPFFTTRAPGVGAGLGLFAVRGIVTTVGGQVECESEPGDGALFRLTLPVATVDAGERDSVTPHADTRLRVLLVDDEPQVRTALARMLSAHDVTLCEDGIHALALCRIKRFDVLLTDVAMPGLSGRGLHERLAREGHPLAKRTVFLTGGVVDHDDARYVQQSGSCLYKPVERRALLDALDVVAAAVVG